MIDRSRFIVEYRRSAREVLSFVTPEKQRLIAEHNAGWHPDRYRFDAYLAASETRYLRVIDNFNRFHGESSDPDAILDVGGFLGAFPLALARCGADVTLVEEYGYYDTAFDDLVARLTDNGVTILPADFSGEVETPPKRRFDLVTAMAILEHLPNSPRPMMENILACLEPDGLAAVEVPNIAYWPNRVRALKGESIHQPLQLLYVSAPPFTGHHREYTAEELRTLLHWTGFDVLSLTAFNYTMNPRGESLLRRLRMLVTDWPALAFESCREVILATACPARPGSPTIGPAAAPGSRQRARSAEG